MERITILLLLTAVSIATVFCGGDDGNYVPPQPPKPTTHPTTASPNVTTTSKTTTTSTTSKPTSTTVTPPTTHKTTSATTPKSTTTLSTTPSPPHSTTPIPDPPVVDPPKPGTWVVNYTEPAASSKTCLLTRFAVQVEIPYSTVKNLTKIAHINIPPEANVTGKCEVNFDQMTLTWGNENGTNNAANFVFDKGNKTYSLKSFEFVIVIDKKNFPGYNASNNIITLQHTHPEFATTLKKSYKCAKEQTFNLTGSSAPSNLIAGHIHISHVQLQAFHNATGKSFSEAEDCEPFDTPDVVPIAVGCALAALVIIVLIAYLIGRRRSQARGYLSM